MQIQQASTLMPCTGSTSHWTVALFKDAGEECRARQTAITELATYAASESESLHLRGT